MTQQTEQQALKFDHTLTIKTFLEQEVNIKLHIFTDHQKFTAYIDNDCDENSYWIKVDDMSEDKSSFTDIYCYIPVIDEQILMSAILDLFMFIYIKHEALEGLDPDTSYIAASMTYFYTNMRDTLLN